MAFRNTRNYRNGLIPNHCEIPDCTFNAMITRHRIKAGRNGGKYVLGNVIGLCPNHHILAELGYYTQYQLFQIVQLRIRQEQLQEEQVRMNLNGYHEAV